MTLSGFVTTDSAALNKMKYIITALLFLTLSYFAEAQQIRRYNPDTVLTVTLIQ
jgi:hypothetical protein